LFSLLWRRPLAILVTESSQTHPLEVKLFGELPSSETRIWRYFDVEAYSLIETEACISQA